MPYGEWIILDEETNKEYGYFPYNLSYGSEKLVVVKCTNCTQILAKSYKTIKKYHLCTSIKNGTKYCFKCKQWLEIEKFSKNRHRKDGLQKVCKSCFSLYECVQNSYKQQGIKRKKAIKNSIEGYFKYKASNLKFRAKKKNIAFDLDDTYLCSMYYRQNGKCYYTGLNIQYNGDFAAFDSISIDRINPDLGYIKDNIVLCCYGINTFKGTLSEDEFKKMLKRIIPMLLQYANKSSL